MSESETSWREILNDLKARGLRAPLLRCTVPEKRKGEVHRQLREIRESTTRNEARSKIDSLADSLTRDYPKAAACVRDEVDRMIVHVAFPKAGWKSLRL